MGAVSAVDSKYDKDVWDVKLLQIDVDQQYVQLVVRANFRPPRLMEEVKQMTLDLKRNFDPTDKLS